MKVRDRDRAAVLLFAIAPILQPRVVAQLPSVADDRFAGLQWRFVRIKYHYVTERHAPCSRISTASRG